MPLRTRSCILFCFTMVFAGCATDLCGSFCGAIRLLCFDLPRYKVRWRGAFWRGMGRLLPTLTLFMLWSIAINRTSGCCLVPMLLFSSSGIWEERLSPHRQHLHLDLHSGGRLDSCCNWFRGGFAIGSTVWLRKRDTASLGATIVVRCLARRPAGASSIGRRVLRLLCFS